MASVPVSYHHFEKLQQLTLCKCILLQSQRSGAKIRLTSVQPRHQVGSLWNSRPEPVFVWPLDSGLLSHNGTPTSAPSPAPSHLRPVLMVAPPGSSFPLLTHICKVTVSHLHVHRGWDGDLMPLEGHSSIYHQVRLSSSESPGSDCPTAPG
jgi:hypothetical protein